MRRSIYLRALALFALLALVVMVSAQPRNNRREEDAAASKPPAAAAAAPAPAAPLAEKAAAPAKKGAVRGFIRVSGNKFVDENCGDFIPIGWNCEWSSVFFCLGLEGEGRKREREARID